MRIVYIGAVEFSLCALKHLVEKKSEIVGVCTLKKSKSNADHVDLSRYSEAHGIPTLYSDDINSDNTIEWIKSKSPDVIFCFGWSKLIKRKLLDIPPLGVVGFHPTALPKNRGRHPLIWALVLGLKSTASTFFFINAGVDSGDIISQREISIDEEDDARTLYDKVIQTALKQLDEFIPLLAKGNFTRIKQDETIANIWRKRNIADGTIDWRMSAECIHNLVRGLTKPYAGAHFMLDGKEIKVWKTSIIKDVECNIEPGKVLLQSGSGTVIKCGVGAIALLITEPEFKASVGSYL